MSEPTEERLLRQLNDATTVARELLTDIRSATKDLRHAIKHARQERERVAATVEDAVGADIDAAVKRELDEVARVVNEKRQWMVDQVTREFDRLINVLTTGREDGRTVPARDLRSVVRLPSLQPPADRQQSTRGRRR
jgi:chorismate mutase